MMREEEMLSRLALAREVLDTIHQREEAAFKAGYHCQWIRAERRYIFDPLMKPGDPDGAFQAWLSEQE